MIDIARKVARRNSQPWHDVDDIEGYIVLQMVRRQPQEVSHAYRVAYNAKIDWIRKERGAKGQRSLLRDTYDLDDAHGVASNDHRLECVESFSNSERKIIAGLAAGYNRRTIAQQLGWTIPRVSKTVAAIRSKLEMELEHG